jgi:hypothetical protein
MAIPKGYRLDVPVHVMFPTGAYPLGQTEPPAVSHEAATGRDMRAAGLTRRAA